MIISAINQQYNSNFEAWKPTVKKPAIINTSEIKTITDKPKKEFQGFWNGYVLGYPKRLSYTWKHKKAFLEVEKELCGKNSIRGYLHDLDKLIMYAIGVPKKIAHDIHVSTAPHHIKNGKAKNPIMTVIDWECARRTKPDKPFTARYYYEHFCPKMPEIEEALEKLGL